MRTLLTLCASVTMVMAATVAPSPGFIPTPSGVISVSNTMPKGINGATEIVLESVDQKFITVDKALAVKYFGLLKQFSEVMTEGLSEESSPEAIPLPNPEHTAQNVIQLFNWVASVDRNGESSPRIRDAGIIYLVNFLNLENINNARTNFFKAATPQIMDPQTAMSIDLQTPVIEADAHRAYKLYRKRLTSTDPKDQALAQSFRSEHIISLHDAVATLGTVDQKFVIANESEMRSLTIDDREVNRFFTNNPHAILIVDFGDATQIGNWFGRDGLSYSSTIPTAIHHMMIQGDRLTSVGNAFLYDCTGLTSLTLPDGLTSVGHRFLNNCKGLTSLTLPNGLTSVGGWFLYNCSRLTSLTLPDGLTSVGHLFLNNCKGLTSLILPDGLTSVGHEFLYGCTKLTSLTLPDGLTSVGNNFLSWCIGLTSLTLPDGLTSVGQYFLYECTGLTPGSVIVKKGTATEKTLSSRFSRDSRFRFVD